MCVCVRACYSKLWLSKHRSASFLPITNAHLISFTHNHDCSIPWKMDTPKGVQQHTFTFMIIHINYLLLEQTKHKWIWMLDKMMCFFLWWRHCWCVCMRPIYYSWWHFRFGRYTTHSSVRQCAFYHPGAFACSLSPTIISAQCIFFIRFVCVCVLLGASVGKHEAETEKTNAFVCLFFFFTLICSPNNGGRCCFVLDTL